MLEKDLSTVTLNGNILNPFVTECRSLAAFTEYAEKYQEILDRQDYFHDNCGDNGNEE